MYVLDDVWLQADVIETFRLGEERLCISPETVFEGA
jgi:hypothetical protein